MVLFHKGWWLSSGLLWQSSSSTSLLLRFLHLCYNMILILTCISCTFQWWSDLNDNVLPCQAMQWFFFLNCFHSRLSLWSTPACWREILAISNWSKSATYNFNSSHILSQSLPAHLTRRQTLLFTTKVRLGQIPPRLGGVKCYER